MRGPDANRVYSQGLSRDNCITDEHVVDRIGGHALIRDVEYDHRDQRPASRHSDELAEEPGWSQRMAGPYPEMFVAPMRQELTDLGVRELRTPADVDAAVTGTAGTLMIVVNSVCGCAAGKARPGIALALRNSVKPAVVATVFAGADVEATDRARQYFAGYRPSSPSIALMRDGQVVYMLERSQIENRDALSIASELTAAFEKFCPAPTTA